MVYVERQFFLFVLYGIDRHILAGLVLIDDILVPIRSVKRGKLFDKNRRSAFAKVTIFPVPYRKIVFPYAHRHKRGRFG